MQVYGKLFYLRLAPLLCLFFTGSILLIYTQPRDNRAVQALLVPEDCTMPCFMGIKPGVTHADEALKILEASQWVEGMRVRTSVDMSGMRLDWAWNGLQPAIFDASTQVTLRAEAYETFNSTEALAQHAVVESISLMTTIQYGDVRLILGRGINRPDYVTERRSINRQISAIYSDYALIAQSTLLTCPVSVAEFWNTPMQLVIGYAQIDPGGRIVCRRVA